MGKKNGTAAKAVAVREQAVTQASSMPLYAVAEEFARELAKLEALDLDEQTFNDTMEGLRFPLEIKASNVGAYLLNLEARASMAMDVAERIEERAKAEQRRADRLREYLHAQLEKAGVTEIKALDNTFAIRVRKNPPSVVIDSEIELPAQYVEVRTDTKVNKKAVGDALKAGTAVPGAHLEQSTRLVVE